MKPEESIDIISRMLSDTRRNVLSQSYVPFLTWGGTTVVVGLLVYFLVRTSGNADAYFCWFLIPLLGYPLTKIFTPRAKCVRTAISSSLQSIWRMLAVVLVGFAAASFFTPFNVLFLILLLLSVGSYVSGAIINYSFLKYSALAGFAASVLMLVMSGINRIPVFVAAIAVMMIVPGVKMKQDLKDI